MTTEEMLAKLVEKVDELAEGQKSIIKDIEAIRSDIEEIKEDAQVTRFAVNHNGEKLEELIDYLNVPINYVGEE